MYREEMIHGLKIRRFNKILLYQNTPQIKHTIGKQKLKIKILKMSRDTELKFDTLLILVGYFNFGLLFIYYFY